MEMKVIESEGVAGGDETNVSQHRPADLIEIHDISQSIEEERDIET